MIRDISVPHKELRALKKVFVRQANSEDHLHFGMDDANFGLVSKNIPHCYVAITEEDVPCFRQWLIGAKENEKIKEFWGDSYPTLNEDEALIENAFTIPKFRGIGIMPYAMNLIAIKAMDFGAKIVITFTPEDNVNSLRACHYAGFRPYILRTEKWFLFRKTTTFRDIPEDLLDYYNKILGNRK